MNFKTKELVKSVFTLCVFILMFNSFKINAQRVNPYHSGSYYPGLIDIRDLVNPEPGIYLLDYMYWVKSKQFYDAEGNKFNGGQVNLPDGNDIDVNINPSINAYINAPLLFYASKFKIFNARYLASVSPIYMNMNTDFFLLINDSSGNIKSNVSGFGDLTIMPIGLSWDIHDKVDFSLLYSMYIPTGKYEVGADDNLGQGYWTHQIQVPTYFYFLGKATALILLPTLEINGNIQKHDASIGNRFSLEYGISQYLTDWLEIDIMNAHNWQISKDYGNEIWWSGTRFDGLDTKSIFSAGISLWPIENTLNIRGKYITEYNIKQRFKNEIWSLSVVYIPGILSDKK